MGVAAGTAACAILAPQKTAAQSMSDVLRFLVTNQSVATGSIDRDRAAADATGATIGGALLASLATLPVSSSTSAFIYRLNPDLGVVERATSSFGPLFTERAVTSGRGRGSFGVTVQHFRFDHLDGRPLRSGTLVTTANQFVDESAPFDQDHLTLALDADVTTLHGTVGLTDRIDVGVAAPIVALRLAGTRVNTYRGQTFTQASATATAIGPADVVARTKIALYDSEGVGLAAGADVRLPTGARDDLLGAGRASVRLTAIGSVDQGRMAAHANVSGSLGGLARDLAGAMALAVVASHRLTLVGELQARRLRQPGRIAVERDPHPVLVDVDTLRLGPEGRNLVSLTVSPGLKWNVDGAWVLVASLTIPLVRQGLTTTLTPYVGFDWALGL